MKILLLEEITDTLAKDVVNQLSAIKKNEPIEVIIFSYGGDMLAGNAIIQALKDTGSHITTNVIGVAASMASVISQVGHVRTISPDARFNIHNGEMQPAGRQTKESHIEAAQLLDKMDAQMINAFSKSTMEASELKALMQEDLLLTAEEALELGFFDSFSESIEIAANFKTINNYNDMNKLQSILKEVKARAFGIKAALSEDEAARKSELEGMEELTDEQAVELEELRAKDAEEEAPEASAEEETGAEILQADYVAKKVFTARMADNEILNQKVFLALSQMPSREEMLAEVKKEATKQIDNVLRAIKSGTTIPTAKQNFSQPTATGGKRLNPNFIANFKNKK